jgi:hypothetical protein
LRHALSKAKQYGLSSWGAFEPSAAPETYAIL